MKIVCKYPLDFRKKVLSEYRSGKVGYKTLAARYGISRDTVRYWVLNCKKGKRKNMRKPKETKSTIDIYSKDVSYYKTAALFWETYARTLEEHIAGDNKKKELLKQSEDAEKKQG